MALTGGFGGGNAGEFNPMMLAMLGDNVDELLPLFLMQQGGATGGKDLQSLLPLLLLGDKGGKSKDLLPLLAMSGGLGGAQGANGFNPMMMLALGDGELDVTTLALMGGFGQGGLFGQASAKKEVKGNE
jgi:hypothetical protein